MQMSMFELDKNEKEKLIDIKLYKRMIDSLLHLITSRPYIMFSMCIYIEF